MVRHPVIPVAAIVIVVAALVACSRSPAAAPSSFPISPAVATAPTTTSAMPGVNPSSPARSAPTSGATAAHTTIAAASTGGHGVDPNAPEVVEPGDIPDDQVFAFQPPGQHFSVKVPEGWAQSDTGGGGSTTFSDHYNPITIAATTATQSPTVDDMRSTGLANLTGNTTFRLGDIKTVQRRGGDGLVATYEIGSDPNPVTGKRALSMVERYAFFHGDTLVTLTSSGAKGADNADPWRTVTDSLTWT